MPYGVTKLELERAVLIANGLTYQEIADKLYISKETVKSSMRSIRNKVLCEPHGGQTIPAIMELIRRKLLVWDRDRTKIIINPYMWPKE